MAVASALEAHQTHSALFTPDNAAEEACVSPGEHSVESFTVEDGTLVRHVLRRDGSISTRVAARAQSASGPLDRESADNLLLRATRRPDWSAGATAPVLDLFAGCGGLSAGVGEALYAVGRTPVFRAFDLDQVALDVYERNLPRSRATAADITALVDGELGAPPTPAERDFISDVGRCEILIAGPPCQGHSAANNRTRHSDARNELYLRVVRAAELLNPQHVAIENVPGAMSDRGSVVDRALRQLKDLGYHVAHGIIDASAVGAPQRRKRLVVLASRSVVPSIPSLLKDSRVSHPRTTRWAFEDLQDISPERLVDEPARSAKQTLERIDVLFDENLHELPDAHRPPCHSGGGHSYVSIYGRLRWDEPAQTLTTGFYSMCMGRNVHPSRRRTITAHEAARIQGFSDWFSFDGVQKRVELSRMIGNAVPPRLGFVVGLELMR